jgi:hypothetical protein
VKLWRSSALPDALRALQETAPAIGTRCPRRPGDQLAINDSVGKIHWHKRSAGRFHLQRAGRIRIQLRPFGTPAAASSCGPWHDAAIGLQFTCTRIMWTVDLTLSIDEMIVKCAREKLRTKGRSINQEIQEHSQHLAGDDDLELAIEFLEVRDRIEVQ